MGADRAPRGADRVGTLVLFLEEAPRETAFFMHEYQPPRGRRPPKAAQGRPTLVQIRRPHWRRACGNIGLLDMKLKVNNQVRDTIISLAWLSQISLKEGPTFPPRTQSGSVRPP